MTIAAAWAEVLGVPYEDVVLHLGSVGTLMAETRRAARETGSEHFATMDGHLTALAECIFPQRIPFSEPVQVLRPEPNAMQMLGTLSYALQLESREGQIPAADELEELRDNAAALVADLASAHIPPEIRRVLVDRMNELLEAIEHLKVGGPNAVRKAAEALAISAILYDGDYDSADTGVLFQRIKKTAKTAWVAFTVTTQLATAVLTWERIIDIPAIGTGTEQRQLLPGTGGSEDGGKPEAESPAH